jgi:hypothetical protein
MPYRRLRPDRWPAGEHRLAFGIKDDVEHDNAFVNKVEDRTNSLFSLEERNIGRFGDSNLAIERRYFIFGRYCRGLAKCGNVYSEMITPTKPRASGRQF